MRNQNEVRGLRTRSYNNIKFNYPNRREKKVTADMWSCQFTQYYSTTGGGGVGEGKTYPKHQRKKTQKLIHAKSHVPVSVFEREETILYTKIEGGGCPSYWDKRLAITTPC